jgi:heme exporter protein D
MQFDSLADFFAMSGYGFFVWIAFGLSFLALFILVGFTFWQKRHSYKVAATQLERAQRIKAARKNKQKEALESAKAEATVAETER